jgi:hypothetical protein
MVLAAGGRAAPSAPIAKRAATAAEYFMVECG